MNVLVGREKEAKTNNYRKKLISPLKEVKSSVSDILALDEKAKKLFKTIQSPESKNAGVFYNEQTIKRFIQKYPNISEEKFKKIFFTGNYNRNILMGIPEILNLFDFNNIVPGIDLIEIYIKNLGLSENEFQLKIDTLKIDVLTFPGISSSEIVQQVFRSKLANILKNTKIIFGDEIEIIEYNGKNKIDVDSEGFWRYLERKPNICIFKLLQSKFDPEKLSQINNIFNSFEEDVFIGRNSEGIPFSTKNIGVKNITLARYSEKKGDLKLNKNSLENSLGYLNSAYYADKVTGVFIAREHNIMEPLHAGKLTISNNLSNRHNHNWLASYLGEKVGLLHFVDSKNNFLENQKAIEEFLSTPKEEIKIRKEKLYSLINSEIKDLINGYLYTVLKQKFKTRD
ncbi:MAG: hypothetical protein PHG82_04330 [Candidatus Gracilibacteria bacterium]|nr:hypothetical protein [Candidatus Gracilibacteria bacterium]